MKRNKYSHELKAQVVKEVLETGNASIVARRHNIDPILVNRWVRNYKRYGTFHLAKSQLVIKDNLSSHKEYKTVMQENEKLKKLLGEKDLEIAILRDLLKKTNPHLPIK